MWALSGQRCLALASCSFNSGSEPDASDGTTSSPDLSGGPVGVPECGAYWGAYVNAPIRTGENNAVARLKALRTVESDLNRTFDLDHHFYRWDNLLSDFSTTNHVEKSIEDGRTQFLSWKPVYEDGINIAWSSIADGKHDALIKEKAGRVAALDQPVMLVFEHEANSRVGDFEPGPTNRGHITSKAGSPEDFVAAWKHIHGIFADEEVSNVSWVWIMTRSPFKGTADQADQLYPGDDYVDWVGLDPYNFFHGQKNWSEMSDLMAGFTSWVETREIDKPWLLGEWGSVEDPDNEGRKAEWIRNAADYFESEKRIKAIVHFDSFPSNNWLYDSSESSRESFIEVSNRPYLNQQC